MSVHRSLILLMKRELGTYILLEIPSGVMSLLRVTTLNPFFSISYWITGCPDADSWVSAYLLINISSLIDIISTCSGYILGCLWLYSASNEDVKDTDRSIYILAPGIQSIYAKKTCIGSTYTVVTWIRYADIGVFIPKIFELDVLVLKMLVAGIFVLEMLLLELLSQKH